MSGWSIIIAFELAVQVAIVVGLRASLMSLPTRNLVLLLVGVDLVLIASFCAAAYGLARRLEWGRRLFIGLTVLRFGSLIGGLFWPGTIFSQTLDQTSGRQWWLLGRYLISLVLPIWYLNLNQVRAWFKVRPE
jgi:carbon starvation protein CstA